MNILFLCSRFPYPPNRGDKLRAFNIIRALSSSKHRLFLISFIERKSDYTYIDLLRPYCEQIIVEYLPTYRSYLNVARAVFSKKPLQIAYYASNRMKKIVDDFILQNKVDLIYVHLFRMVPFVDQCHNLYKLVDLTDAISSEIEKSLTHRSGLDRWIYSAELPRIRGYERRISEEFNECWVISPRDAEILRIHPSKGNIMVIPNGVDTAYFRPLNLQTEGKSIIFVGHLRVAHNVDAVLFFYRDIFPFIVDKYPETKLCIVGPDPHPKIKKLSRDPSVLVTGFVQDLNHFLNTAQVFVAPLRFSSGIQNKILEAMSAGVPVVCSTIANEGMRAGPGKEILVADHPRDFANLVLELMSCPQEARLIGQRARAFVERNFKWKFAADRIAEIEEIIQSQTAPDKKLRS